MIKHIINGQQVDSRETFQTINPATGEVIAEVASGGAAEINAAVAAAKAAFPGWAATPVKERARLVRKLGEGGLGAGFFVMVNCASGNRICRQDGGVIDFLPVP